MSRKVTRGERQITLQPREFKLLEYLMRHAGQVVTRTMLLENVWDYHFDPQTNVVDVHISKLRQKIDAEFERPLLRTVRNAGYMVTAPSEHGAMPMLRSSAISLAIGYIAWASSRWCCSPRRSGMRGRCTMRDGRSEILQADAQRLAEVFRREARRGLKNFIDARCACRSPASASYCSPTPPARRWPATCPPGRACAGAAGDYGRTWRHRRARAFKRRWCTSLLLGGYDLLVGRDNRAFAPLETALLVLPGRRRRGAARLRACWSGSSRAAP